MPLLYTVRPAVVSGVLVSMRRVSGPSMEVFTAIDCATELRWLLEHADFTDPAQRVWVAHEAELLEHWASFAAHEHAALAEGLADFARYCFRVLARAERFGDLG